MSRFSGSSGDKLIAHARHCHFKSQFENVDFSYFFEPWRLKLKSFAIPIFLSFFYCPFILCSLIPMASDARAGFATSPATFYNPDTKPQPVSETQSLHRSISGPAARQKWYQYFSPDDTPAERGLIVKLDVRILIFVFLAYWAKVLDPSSTSTAYVSGMKEDLSLYGNQLNYLNAVYM